MEQFGPKSTHSTISLNEAIYFHPSPPKVQLRKRIFNLYVNFNKTSLILSKQRILHKMLIFDLPTKLYYMIFKGLKNNCDINALAYTNCYFHSILNACLYECKGSSALFWAAKLGQSNTAKLALPSIKAADLGIPLLWALSKGHVYVV